MATKKISMGNISELFNQASSSEREENGFKVDYIDIDDIVRNENNDYSIQDIEELAVSISLVGIRQNLEVMPIGGGKYRLISGERRYTAVKKLVTEDGREDLRKLPCKVTVPEKNIGYDIPSEIKELWLLTTNNSQREKTEADRLIDIRNQKKIYQALIAAGVELDGKQRDWIAKSLDMSSAQVQRYEFIDKNLSPELKQGFEDNKIPLTVAVDVAKQDAKGQKKLAGKLAENKKITQADVDTLKESKKEPEYDQYIISASDFKFLETPIYIEDIKEGTVVSGKSYQKLKAAQEKIEKQQKIIKDIVEKAVKKYK